MHRSHPAPVIVAIASFILHGCVYPNGVEPAIPGAGAPASEALSQSALTVGARDLSTACQWNLNLLSVSSVTWDRKAPWWEVMVRDISPPKAETVTAHQECLRLLDVARVGFERELAPSITPMLPEGFSNVEPAVDLLDNPALFDRPLPVPTGPGIPRFPAGRPGYSIY